jgi:GalNAc-alpha-(1->4)-GalNAc-alpha-(1->3)-diNAcBac-PP-undecaprenol alpha-1,4-N-acetyl-D-galactosaminyltransferase
MEVKKTCGKREGAPRITFVISSLSAGGTERVLSTMASYLAEEGWPVSILTLDDGREAPFYCLHPGVAHTALSLASPSANAVEGVINNMHRAIVLRRAITQTSPHAVVGFSASTSVLTLVATRGLRVPVIACERNDPWRRPIGTAWEKLRRWSYSWAACLVVQTERARSYFPPALQHKIRVIPNPVNPAAAGLALAPRKDRHTVIAMGRLIELKGFDLLVRASAKVLPHRPCWSLEIWGDGPLRSALDTLVDGLGLRGRVRMPGRTDQPYEKMQAADLFVLPSRSEGFPNALCEAMACGLPVISFDCPNGPREIVRDGIDGVLVPPEDVDGLAAAMDRLMADESERRRLATRAPQVLARFGTPQVMAVWEETIQQVIEATAGRRT